MTTPEEFGPGPQETADQPEREPPIAALAGDLADDLRNLLRLEVALFKIELGEKLRRLGRGIMAVAIAGILAIGAWLLLLAAAALGLATVLRPWLAALVVGMAALAVAALLLYVAKRLLDARQLVPRRTLSTLRARRTGTKDDPP